jgi:hypothetical protein
MSRTIFNSLNTFDLFVEKHKDQFLEIKVPEHPLNIENVGKWIKKHTDPLDITIATIISTNITNVSYDNIVDKLNGVANELYILSKTNIPLFLYIPTETRKSNFFFTVLFYWICKKKDIRFTDIVSNSNRYFNTTDDPNIIVMVDDASYSGGQICDILSIQDIKYNHQIFFAIPYISDTARLFIAKDIEPFTSVIFPSSIETFKNMTTIVKEYDEELVDKIKIYDRYVQTLSDKHLLYIDFKLPDSISIPQTIFAFGYRLSDPDNTSYKTEDEVLSFISGCEETYKRGLGKPKGVLDLNDEFLIPCPNSFYKNIIWKF